MKRLLTICAPILFAACGEAAAPAAAPQPETPVTHGAEIALVQPDSVGGLTINEALALRSSSREYSEAALTLEELSGTMWAAAGINRPESGKLTAPSALALYPVTAYAVFKEGTYRYDATAHKLVRVSDQDLRAAAGMQEFVATASLNILYVADMSKYEGRNIPAEKVRYLCGQDAAGYAENVNLYAAGHSLKAITRGSADEAALLAALGLDPARYFLALAQSVGK